MDMQPLFDRRPAKHVRPGPSAAGPSTAGALPRVLLADGDADVHAVYGLYLEHAGYAPVHAYSAEECVRLARSLPLAAAVVTVGHCGLLPWSDYHRLVAAADGRFAVLCLTTDPRLVPESCRSPLHAAAVLTIPCEPTALVAEIRRAVRAAEGA